jgi:hypothetical protein
LIPKGHGDRESMSDSQDRVPRANRGKVGKQAMEVEVARRGVGQGKGKTDVRSGLRQQPPWLVSRVSEVV